MARRKALPSRLNPKNYPRPTRWHEGFVSRAQARKFNKAVKLRKFYGGMLANTPGGNTVASRLNRLPQRVGKKRTR